MDHFAAANVLRLLSISGHLLRLPATTRATAVVLFHRVNDYLKTTDMSNVPQDALREQALVMALLNLASKQTESHRKLRDIVNCTYWAYNHNASQDKGHLQIGKEYWTWRDILVTTELVVLRILNFDLQVHLPFQWLPEIIDDICAQDKWDFSGGVGGRNAILLAQVSWDYVCLAVSVERIVTKHSALSLALACVFVAMKAAKFRLPWTVEKWCGPYQKQGSCTVDQLRDAIKDMSRFA
ncbi:hypothetical protein SeMB42_g06229 [Synchytrium endobioticum]|uniref:Cyclin N-terminal domain-containing protein n=1 Tax=Synchytrium endobioticum TaxID=286115 RepID=A0A507CJV2_9FUNG|nr:hypothetical protein SeMB42_g06229 [Synchytrium endobioticum]TPX41352.1 hypothetical protein SeLEV6574_g06131 [Synchytrium endobioticum]